jgi:hypothetical protein
VFKQGYSEMKSSQPAPRHALRRDVTPARRAARGHTPPESTLLSQVDPRPATLGARDAPRADTALVPYHGWARPHGPAVRLRLSSLVCRTTAGVRHPSSRAQVKLPI